MTHRKRDRSPEPRIESTLVFKKITIETTETWLTTKVYYEQDEDFEESYYERTVPVYDPEIIKKMHARYLEEMTPVEVEWISPFEISLNKKLIYKWSCDPTSKT